VGAFFFSSRRRHTRFSRDWSSDVCSSDLRLKSSPSMRQKLPARHSASSSLFGPILQSGSFYCPKRRTMRFPSKGKGCRRPCWRRSEERRVGKEGKSREVLAA